jgi:hypothetical protein
VLAVLSDSETAHATRKEQARLTAAARIKQQISTLALRGMIKRWWMNVASIPKLQMLTV